MIVRSGEIIFNAGETDTQEILKKCAECKFAQHCDGPVEGANGKIKVVVVPEEDTDSGVIRDSEILKQASCI